MERKHATDTELEKLHLDLRAELNKVEAPIAVLEGLSQSAPQPVPLRKRGRKCMGPEERKQVSSASGFIGRHGANHARLMLGAGPRYAVRFAAMSDREEQIKTTTAPLGATYSHCTQPLLGGAGAKMEIGRAHV